MGGSSVVHGDVVDAVDGSLQVVQLPVQGAGQSVQHTLGVEQFDGLGVRVVVHFIGAPDA